MAELGLGLGLGLVSLLHLSVTQVRAPNADVFPQYSLRGSMRCKDGMTGVTQPLANSLAETNKKQFLKFMYLNGICD
jgi:hypothetical protein